MLTPRRRRGVELLDDPAADAALALRSLRDVARANMLFGGTRAVLTALDSLLRTATRESSLTLLDAGSGLGDIPRAAARLAKRRNVQLMSVGVEFTAQLAAAARTGAGTAVCADARALPFADRSVDVVTCSQVLHHFDDAQARFLLLEFTRVARRAVIVSDLRRSWVAASLLWCVSFPLGFHAVSRHDGVVSIIRGYTTSELAKLVYESVGRRPTMRRRMGWRITAVWSPP